MANDLNQRDAKLVQWLNEAHAKEAELERDLAAHISLTHKDSYRKRLQSHLSETSRHKRQVATRIRELGGSVEESTMPVVPGPVGELAGRAMATVKGGVGIVRAAVTEQAETHLRNAQEELREEHVEIALYARLEALASEVGDRDTTRLAKGIRREEERMAKFLDAELVRLVKDVVRAEIPADQRARRSTRSRVRAADDSRTSRPSRGASGSRSTSASSSRTTRARSGSRSTGRSGSSSTRRSAR